MQRVVPIHCLRFFYDHRLNTLQYLHVEHQLSTVHVFHAAVETGRKKSRMQHALKDTPFLGVVLVARQAAGQAQAIFQYPSDDSELIPQSLFGIGAIEFGKFSMPAQWLINRKLDFEIGVCGPSIAARMTGEQPRHRRLRFVSFPCECASPKPDVPAPPTLVTAFNIVFVFAADEISDQNAELYWQALTTVSRAIISEEERAYYLSDQVSCILSAPSRQSLFGLNLISILVSAYESLKSPDSGVSLYVNDSVLTHIGVIPFSHAPDPPSGYQSLLLTCDMDELQKSLPVDSSSNVRRLIDSAEPSRTIKDHMVELGLPISTIQRISQHLVYWKKAKIVHPLNKRIVLALADNGTDEIVPSSGVLAALSTRFKIPTSGALTIFMKILYLFSHGKKLYEVKELVLNELPQLHAKFNDLCFFLLSRNIIAYSLPYYRYFPPNAPLPTQTAKRLPVVGRHRPKFQNQLPHDLRSQFSPLEFETIFERLRENTPAAELMVKLIAKYAKKHKDIMTARIELNEQFRCTNDDFHNFTECLSGSGYMDGLLVRYESDEV